MKPDFAGYATKANLLCTDGRTIGKDAFADCNGKRVPLMWQHFHNDPKEVLGHVDLEHREDGVYAYGYFNDTETGRHAKELVKHGDINAMSIHANQLKHRGNTVTHGNIIEVSLVMSGANPGALIDFVSLEHSDGRCTTLVDEAVITTDELITLEPMPPAQTLAHADSETNIADILSTLNEEQKTAVYGLLGMALSVSDDEVEQSDDLEDDMKTNTFDAFSQDGGKPGSILTHAQKDEIMRDAIENKRKLSEAVLSHAQEYGIENLEILFPDATNIDKTPQFIKRDADWVTRVINGARHTPFARIRNTFADITADEARAKGYVKGNRKKDEVIKVMKRVTTPTTIYKRQKLDRDDIIDIDFDVVPWIKAEMRLMLDEEIARAAIIGDGRPADSPDKINEDNVRPIVAEDEMYVDRVILTGDNTALIEQVLRARKNYNGSGNPSFFTTEDVITDVLLEKDANRRRIYNTEAEVAAAMRVRDMVSVPVMEGATMEVDGTTYEIVGVLVNMSDYSIGADRGGQISTFDDFDIDFNQYIYLMETRISGSLTRYKSAQVFLRPVGAASARMARNTPNA